MLGTRFEHVADGQRLERLEVVEPVFQRRRDRRRTVAKDVADDGHRFRILRRDRRDRRRLGSGGNRQQQCTGGAGQKAGPHSLDDHLVKFPV